MANDTLRAQPSIENERREEENRCPARPGS